MKTILAKFKLRHSLSKALVACGLSALSASMVALIEGCGTQNGYAFTNQKALYQFLYFGNYGSSTIAPFYLDQFGNLIRAASTIATGNGTASVAGLAVSSTSGFLYAANENTSNLSAYAIAPLTASIPVALTPLQPVFTFAAQSGPTSLSISPSGLFAYVTNYLSGSTNISVFGLDKTSGSMTSLSTIAARTNPVSSVLTPSGSFLYVANRATSDISSYSVNAATGALTLLNLSTPTCTNPENLQVQSSGQLLLVVCSTTSQLAVFSIGADGTLTATSQGAVNTGTQPMRMAIASSSFVYTANYGSNSVSAFSVDKNGTLTGISGSPFAMPSGFGAYGIAVSPDRRFLVVTGDTTGTAMSASINAATGAIQLNSAQTLVGTNPRSVVFVDFTRQE